jgi:hypothetical protein
MDKLEAWARVHRKFLVAIAGAALTAIGFAFPDSPWLPVVIAVGSAFGVNQVPNAPQPAKPQPAPADAPPPEPAPQ